MVFDPTKKTAGERKQAESKVFDPTLREFEKLAPPPPYPSPQITGGKEDPLVDFQNKYGKLANADSGEGASSFKARVGSNLVSNPETALRILAADLMPNLPENERLGRIGFVGGEVVYLGDDGQPRVASGGGVVERLKSLAAGATAHTPSIAMGAVGTAGGPFVAGLGAAGGRGLELTAANLIYGDKQTTAGNATDMATEFFIGTGSDIVGRQLAGALQARKAAKIGRDTDLFQVADGSGAGVRDYARDQFGFNLLPQEATESPAQIARFKTMQRLSPEAGESAERFFSTTRAQQIDDATRTALNAIGPDSSVDDLALTGYKAAQQRKTSLTEARDEAASKFYQRAFESGGTVNVADVDQIVRTLDQRIAKADPAQARALQSIRSKLVEESPATQGGRILDSSGRPATPGQPRGQRSITDIERLHNAKLGIDALLAADAKTASDKYVKSIATDVQKRLTNALRRASADYNRGYQEFISASAPIDAFDNSLAGKLAAAEEKNALKKTRELFRGATPKEIAAARAEIEAVDPQAWKNSVRAYLQDVFEGERVLNPARAGAKFQQSVFLSARDVEKLKASLPRENFELLSGYFDIMRRTGRMLGGESWTAFATDAVSEIRDEAAGRLVRGAQKISRPTKALGESADAWERRVAQKYGKKWMDAVLSDNPEEALGELKRLRATNPNTPQYFARAASFLGLSLGDLEIPGDQRSQQQRPPLRR